MVEDAKCEEDHAKKGREYKLWLFGYKLRGDIKGMNSLMSNFANISNQLAESLKEQLSDALDNCLFKAFAIILDTLGYQDQELDDILSGVKEIVKHYEKTMTGAGCNIAKAKAEFITIVTHVRT
jgi:hypothetical protein